MKKVLFIILLIVVVSVSIFYFINKEDTKKKEKKPVKIETIEEKAKEETDKETPDEKAQKQLEKYTWTGTNALGDNIILNFNGKTQLIEETLSNEYTSEENATPYSISEDGKSIIISDKEIPFTVKDKILKYDEVKYTPLSIE